MAARVLVAGVGNVFNSDDGFGVEVARRLAAEPLPPTVRVVDAGIRGVHLAYDLLEGCDLLVLVDAAERGEPPGTVTVLDASATAAGLRPIDPHSLDPHAVLQLVARLGGTPPRVLVVGCEPLTVDSGMALSAPVAAAVDVAVAAVLGVVGEV